MNKVLLAGLVVVVCMLATTQAGAQAMVCNTATVFKFDFGAGKSQDMNLSFLRNYRQTGAAYCPNDGFYTFTSGTSNCFGGNWITLKEDHTPGDVDGKMMLVNASESPGEFFLLKAKGLRPNTIYELSAWIVNVCQHTIGCRMVFPDIDFTVLNNDGKVMSMFGTGPIPQSRQPIWRRYSSTFVTPANVGDILIRLSSNSDGGCGNDFALDDLLLTRCELINPEPAKIEKEPETKPEVKPVVTPVSKPKPELPTPEKRPAPVLIPVKVKETAPEIKPVVRETLNPKPEPIVLKTRANPLVKQIVTEAGEILLELYDNGVIDGDTVSIYHNNELVISQTGLSAKPIRLKIQVDTQHPHHELVMVAHNLGSIPPNTSLMIVTAKDKRYQVFISSDDKKNAKLTIDLAP
ncbi:MAG: hypothetical protein H7Y42_14460 [Chitinophagaceae bacterium]|nr:hypothetical protein [Chitinophagaceae bacterium]